MPSITSITRGTKLKMAYEKPGAETTTFNLMSTMCQAIDETNFLISIPMLDGKPLPFDDTQRFIFNFKLGLEEIIFSAYLDDQVKDGIRNYWKMRRVTELRTFLRRADQRFNVMLRVDYTSDSWKLKSDGTAEMREALTIDVSSGGASMNLGYKFMVGDICELYFPRVGITEEGRPRNVVAAVCWMREAPKGSVYPMICGVQFRFSDNIEREQLKIYMGAVQKKYKL